MDPNDDDLRAAASAPLSDRDRRALDRARDFVGSGGFASRGVRAGLLPLEILGGAALGAAIIAAIIFVGLHHTSAPTPRPSPGVAASSSPSPRPSAPSPSVSASPVVPVVLGAAPCSQLLPSAWDSDVQSIGGDDVWAALNGDIVASTDGGRTWTVQYRGATSGPDPLSIDAIDADHAWSVGTGGLLLTDDGGRSWHQAGEPAGTMLTSVHFVSDSTGYGVTEKCGLVMTEDGGIVWQSLPSMPSGATSVCFINNDDGWSSGGPDVWRTTDGGSSWTPVLKITNPYAQPLVTRLQCAGPDGVALQANSTGAAAGSQPHAAWVSLDGVHFSEVFKSAIWDDSSGAPTGPGAYIGPMSIVSPQNTVWLGVNPSVYPDSAQLVETLGTTLTPAKDVQCDGTATGAAFVSSTAGWVTCAPWDTSSAPQVLFTNNGGASWTVQYTLPE
jgi:Photosynthesis system II assembly factor YCF48